MLQRLKRTDLVKWVLNKYSLTLIIAAVWMLFFDSYNVISQHKMEQTVEQLEEDRAFYREQIAQLQIRADRLKTDPRELERIAREKYLMQRENEDVFVIVDPSQDTPPAELKR